MTSSKRASSKNLQGITLLVADPHPLFADALAIALQRRRFQPHPGRPSSGNDVLDAAMMLRPDVLLVDYWMPQLNGAEIAARTVTLMPNTKVIVLASIYNDIHVEEVLSSGAVGFVPKSAGLQWLEKAIVQATDGHSPVLKDELGALLDKIRARADRASDFRQRLSALTPRELEILKLLASGMSGRQIASELFIDPGTVKRHVHKVLSKTGAASSGEVVAMARDCGLLRE